MTEVPETIKDTIEERTLVEGHQIADLHRRAVECFPGTFGHTSCVDFVKGLITEVEGRLAEQVKVASFRDVGDVVWLASLLVYQEYLHYQSINEFRPPLRDWEQEVRDRRPVVTIDDLTETGRDVHARVAQERALNERSITHE